MKPLRTSLIACAAAALAGPAFAQYLIKPQVMPVVVQVNAQGKVTGVLPSEQLRPKAKALLINQLDAWIAKPAMVKGHPVASTFIVEVAMSAKPRADGKFDVNYVYVKSLPMPFSGVAFWRHIDGNFELQLVDSNTLAPIRSWTPPIDMVPMRTTGTPMATGRVRAASISARVARPEFQGAAMQLARSMPAVTQTAVRNVSAGPGVVRRP